MLRLALSLALVISGCSAVINPDQDRLGAPRDAGGTPTTDAGRVDSGIVLRLDAGRPTDDAGPPPACTDGSRCEGDVLVRCVDGVRSVEDCADRGQLCEGGACAARACEPGIRRCSDDRRDVLVCTARGDGEEAIRCEDGACDPSTRACVDAPDACADLPGIAVNNSRTLDLCDLDDERTHLPADECRTGTRADSGDAAFRLEITTAGRYRIELVDIDMFTSIDTIVSLRRACDSAESQLACRDDDPCSDTFPLCIGGTALGRSTLTVSLEPGVYYIVVDAFLYERDSRRYECGNVRLSVEPASG